jgi:protein phosphatase
MPTSLKPASIHLQIASRTHSGRVRSHNEDSLLVTSLASRGGAHLSEFTGDEVVQPGEGVVLAVCDGMGGAAGGEVASRRAVETIHVAMVRDGNAASRGGLGRRLVASVEEASREVFAVAARRPELSGMGTTATVCALAGDRLLVAQVGDSRAYLLRGGRLTQITRDQTLAMLLVEKGQLALEDIDSFAFANVILQAVGTSGRVEVDLRSVEVYQGDVVLVCSDGLTGLVPAATIRDVLTNAPSPAAASESLIALANEAGGRDNISCIVARLAGEGLRPPPEEPPPPVAERVCLDTEPPEAAAPDEASERVTETETETETEAATEAATGAGAEAEAEAEAEAGADADADAEAGADAEAEAAPFSIAMRRIRSFLGL